MSVRRLADPGDEEAAGGDLAGVRDDRAVDDDGGGVGGGGVGVQGAPGDRGDLAQGERDHPSSSGW